MKGSFPKVGKKIGIDDKAMDEAENEVYDAHHESLSVSADAGFFEVELRVQPSGKHQQNKPL